MSERTCFACAHSGIEPDDMDLTCHHDKARQPFGQHVMRGPIAPCGPDRVLFVQHPNRSPAGELLVACTKQEAGGASGLAKALAYEEMVKAFEKWAEDRPAGGALTPFDAFAAGARWWHAIGKKS